MTEQPPPHEFDQSWTAFGRELWRLPDRTNALVFLAGIDRLPDELHAEFGVIARKVAGFGWTHEIEHLSESAQLVLEFRYVRPNIELLGRFLGDLRDPAGWDEIVAALFTRIVDAAQDVLTPGNLNTFEESFYCYLFDILQVRYGVAREAFIDELDRSGISSEQRQRVDEFFAGLRVRDGVIFLVCERTRGLRANSQSRWGTGFLTDEQIAMGALLAPSGIDSRTSRLLSAFRNAISVPPPRSNAAGSSSDA